MQSIFIHIKRISEGAIIPSYGSAGAAGADLCACLPEPVTVQPGQTVLIHTGIALEIPEGFVGLVCARSGIATKRGLAPANKVGVIDSDYRGEILVSLHNHSDIAATIAPAERIAQILFLPVAAATFCEVEEIDDTSRGAGGFGSTGTV